MRNLPSSERGSFSDDDVSESGVSSGEGSLETSPSVSERSIVVRLNHSKLTSPSLDDSLPFYLLETAIKKSMSVSEMRRMMTNIRVGNRSALEFFRLHFPRVLASVELTLMAKKIGE
jgi:hypothetical protein